MPSIAQLEERGTVMEILRNPKVTGSTPVRRSEPFDSSVGRAWDCNGNTARSQGHWFDPGSKDFLLWSGDDTPTSGSDSARFRSSLTLPYTGLPP